MFYRFLNCLTVKLLVLFTYQTIYQSPKGQRMTFIKAKDFTADRAWGALDITNMNGVTIRLHWTDQPYKWHINDGEEVFVVLEGGVNMHYRVDGVEKVRLMALGDISYAPIGTEHVERPIGEARILVIEKEGSV
jgi:mannose-6-phosphate isomerase-like protein (cupin superfamily)